MFQVTDFDPEKELVCVIEWIRNWFRENGSTADAVIGISGGKDSSIVAALLARALGTDRVLGVMMPNGEQADLQDSRDLVKHLGIRSMEVNIADGVRGMTEALLRDTGLSLSRDTAINLPARMRMVTLYAIAQSLPKGGRVANTCNRSEDYIGYSTKYGDAAGDFSPCSDFTVSEMLMLGDALGVPQALVHKTPSDGLSGLSDEDKIGFTYDVLDRYILTGVCEDPAIREKIDRMHRLNLHKLQVIPAYRRTEAST